MDFKAALLKGMKEIPSSSSLKLGPAQCRRNKIEPRDSRTELNPKQPALLLSSSILRDSWTELNPKQPEPLLSSSILRDSWTELNPRQAKPEIKIHKISSRLVPKIQIQQSSSSSILQDTLTGKNNYRDWLDLPLELTESIMQRVGWYDVLMSAKNVCKTWLEICKGLSAWQVIEIRQIRESKDILIGTEFGFEKVTIYFGEHAIEINCAVEGMELAMKLAMHVIDLSSGQLLDLCFHRFGSDNLLEYISHRSSQLRRLRLQFCDVYSDDCVELRKPPDFHISNKGLIEMLRHLPLLEELQFPYTPIPVECIEVAGRFCPNLKSFTLDEKESYWHFCRLKNNAHALAIVRYMPRLRHLQLFGNRMTDRGLKAIINHCHFLEYLDLRKCYFLYEVLEVDSFLGNFPQIKQARENLARKLRQGIKHVRFPLDSIEDYEFKAEICNFDDDYYY